VSARARGACAARAWCEAPPSGARFDFGHVSVFPPAQPRLEISQPGDAYEQEADRVADEVMRMLIVDRHMPPPDGSSMAEEEEEISPESAPVARVQRQPGGCAAAAMRPAGPAELVPGPGRALDPALRAVFEPRFGFSFDRVRVHTDSPSAAAARSLDALAYTVGPDVVFARGQYAPETPAGKRLLAHELAHVIQQAGAPAWAGTPAVARAPVFRAAGVPRLQRAVRFVAGTVSEVFNLAERVVNRQSAGDTQFLLNGTFPDTVAKGVGALRAPTIASVAASKTRVRCRFRAVRDSEVSWAMKVLAPGPWSYATTKARLRALFTAFQQCTGQDAATLALNGKPQHADQQARTRTHEDQHVADYKDIFDTLLVPWDEQVTEAQKKRLRAEAATEPECEDELYAAHVGNQTPTRLVTAIIDEINQRARTFHASAAGRDVNITNVIPAADCSTITADAT
jgi:Domain of unknown function (DUF4157)